MSNDTNECPETHKLLSDFRVSYGEAHKWVALILCLIGVITNTINVIVLNDKDMRSVTNFLLTLLATSDALVMASYIAFDVYFLIYDHLKSCPEGFAWYLLVHIVLQNALHMFSTWLTVALAVFRLICIRRPTDAARLYSMCRACLAVALIVMATMIVSICFSMAHKVVPVDPNPQTNITLFTVHYAESVMTKINFWVVAIVEKLVPLVLLAVLSILLVLSLREFEARKEKLKGQKNKESSQQAKRTTRLLIAIVVIFVIALLPQAILLVLSGILNECFTQNFYAPVGDLMDLLTLLNTGVNFVLFCSMSKQFRDTFFRLFTPATSCHNSCNYRSRRTQSNALATNREHDAAAVPLTATRNNGEVAHPNTPHLS